MYRTETTIENEKWIPITGYEEIYEVSNFGRVRTVEGKKTQSVRHGTRKWKQRILKPKGMNSETVYKTGYRVTLWKDKKPNDFLVARLVAFNFYGGFDIGDRTQTVDHLDGDRLNNELSNLDICSLKENIRRSFETQGLHRKTQNKIKVTNEKTKVELVFDSMADCDRFLGRCGGYTSALLGKGKNKNGIYIIEKF